MQHAVLLNLFWCFIAACGILSLNMLEAMLYQAIIVGINSFIREKKKNVYKGVSLIRLRILCLFIATPLLHVYMKSQNPAVTVRQNIEDKLQFRNAVPCLMVERVIYCGIQYSLLCVVEIGVAACMLCGLWVFVLVTSEFIWGEIWNLLVKLFSFSIFFCWVDGIVLNNWYNAFDWDIMEMETWEEVQRVSSFYFKPAIQRNFKDKNLYWVQCRTIYDRASTDKKLALEKIYTLARALPIFFKYCWFSYLEMLITIEKC